MNKPHGKIAVIQAIIEAAIPLLAERGINDVSFRDIAKAANVNHGLITRHFGSKEILIQNVSESIGRELFQIVRQNEHLGDFENIWDWVIRDNRIKVRAIARIMLETSSISWDYSHAFSFINEIASWFMCINKKGIQITADETNIMIYMTTALLLGSEVIGDRLQKVLQIDDVTYQELRPQALRIMMEGLRAIHDK